MDNSYNMKQQGHPENMDFDDIADNDRLSKSGQVDTEKELDEKCADRTIYFVLFMQMVTNISCDLIFKVSKSTSQSFQHTAVPRTLYNSFQPIEWEQKEADWPCFLTQESWAAY